MNSQGGTVDFLDNPVRLSVFAAFCVGAMRERRTEAF
jgi:hypothetical protein